MPDQLEQALWTFSLTVYGREGVQEECLDLQERLGVDVNLLLFCAFLGTMHGVMLDHADVIDARKAVHPWHTDIVFQLRKIRRALKPMESDASSGMAAEAEQLRDRVKAVELESERIEQTMLARWAAPRLKHWPHTDVGDAVRSNVGRLLETYGTPGWQSPSPARLIDAALSHVNGAG